MPVDLQGYVMRSPASNQRIKNLLERFVRDDLMILEELRRKVCKVCTLNAGSRGPPAGWGHNAIPVEKFAPPLTTTK